MPLILGDLPRMAVVPNAARPRIAGVRVVRLACVTPASVTWHRGLPIRSVEDALLDLFTVLPINTAQALLDHALQLRWVALNTLAELSQFRLGHGRRGARAIRRLVEQAAGGSHSEAERRMAQLLTTAGIRGWIANHQLRTPSGRVFAELDFAWPKERVYLEVDGWAAHSGREAFEKDHARQNALSAAGWNPLRATWEQITRNPHALIATVRATLSHFLGRDRQLQGSFLPKKGVG